jgi:uncharacterized protein YgiB involved in biofilm formation
MRTTRSLTYALLASTALLLGACDQTPEQPKTETVSQEEILFKNVDECKAAGQFDADQCEALAKDAREEHAKTAPKFDSREACEAQYGAGKCGGQQGSSGTSMSYTPLLAGFLIGAAGAMAAAHVVNGMNRNNTPAYQPRPRPVYETVERDRRPGQTSYASGGTTVGTMMQNGRVQTTVTRPVPPSSGGFFNRNSNSVGSNTNARTPVSPTGPRIQQTTPVTPSANSWSAPKAAPTQAPSSSWSAPKVTPSAPTVSSKPFGGSARTSGGFSGGRSGGGSFG